MNKELIAILKSIVLDSTNKYLDKWAVYRELEEIEKLSSTPIRVFADENNTTIVGGGGKILNLNNPEELATLIGCTKDK